jgi:diadenosine tetraphosphate (Ap4A) HIT family hydrolase
VADWFDATEAEQQALTAALAPATNEIETTHRPDGFNIGINCGEAAGQTVFHLHVHLIPRYRWDANDPRGGVRFILPEKAKYWD